MINYVEKGYGLHEAIAAVGHSLMQVDGVWQSSDDAAVQAVIDAYTLDQAKALKCAEVAKHAKALRDNVIADISAAEMSSWAIKMSEAAKFAATGNGTDAPMLSAEAVARGVALVDLVAKVDGKAQQFAGLEALIAGVDGKHRDAIKVLTTFEDVAAYDYLTSWPGV